MRKGFTLIEVIITLAVIVSLSLVVFVSVLRATRFARQGSVEQIAALISEQLQRYYKLQGSFPMSQEDFENFLENRSYFEHVPVNSFWSGDAEKGWKWDYSNRKLSAVNNGGKIVYSITVPIPKGFSSNRYTHPATYGGDG